MKKSIVFIAFILLSFAAEAQQVLPDGRRFRQRVVDRTPGQTTDQKLPEFNIQKAVGLTIYDVDRVTKKLSIKKKNDHYTKVVSIFNKFNKDQKQVLRINGFTLNQAKTKIEDARRNVLENRDYSVLEKVYKEVSDGFKPITEQIEKREKELDQELKEVLSEKEFKKWKNLQKKIKRKG